MAQRVEEGDGWTLHLGDWRDDVLPEVDATIEDPPYGKRCHAGQKHARFESGTPAGNLSTTGDLGYEHITGEEAEQLASAAARITRGWTCFQTSHDLLPSYEASLERWGRYVFAPIPIVIPAMNCRLAGDGPSSESVHMVVARRRGGDKICWSTKPGYYLAALPDRHGKAVKGAKSVSLMEAILRDYTARGDLVMDRFAGSGTTGVVAIRLGRRFLGWERKPEHFEIALSRLRNARPQAEAFATDGIIGKPMQLPGTEDTDAAE